MNTSLEINLWELFRVLAKRAWIIVLSAVVCAGFFFLYTVNFVAPQYEARVTMYVNNNSNQEGNSVSSNDLSAAVRLVNTYINIIKSDRVLDRVISETGENLSQEALREMISTDPLNETEMFAVVVTSGDPQLSANLANAIADITPGEIAQIIKGSSAEIVDHAKVPTSRSAPSYFQSTALGFLLGALLAVLVIAFTYIFDVSVKSEEDLKQICSVPVLGVIPDVLEIVKKTKKKRRW